MRTYKTNIKSLKSISLKNVYHYLNLFRIMFIGFMFFSFYPNWAQTEKICYYNKKGKGQKITIHFIKGKNFGHPVMAFFLTTTDGKYIQTLYVSETIGKGIYPRGKAKEGKWLPGSHRHTATLPFWSHTRGIKEPDGLFLPTPENPISDAYTGATPCDNFIMEIRLDTLCSKKAIVYLEINQPFDFNDYWHNNKYSDAAQYKKSGQPSVIYAVIIDFDNPDDIYYFNPIGHGHPTGENGKLFTDLSTLTTALHLVKKVSIKIEK